MTMQVKWLHTGPLNVNTFLLIWEDKAAVIDPGGNANDILQELGAVPLTHILLTHGHFDHIGGVEELAQRTDAKICIHPDDAEMLTSSRENLSAYFGTLISTRSADILLKDGDILPLGEGIRVIHTPGHSQGSVCFDTGSLLFSGDTLFYRSIGRTDFPGGSLKQLLSSIWDKLYTLEGDRTVYPGHEQQTSLADEEQNNPNTAR